MADGIAPLQPEDIELAKEKKEDKKKDKKDKKKKDKKDGKVYKRACALVPYFGIWRLTVDLAKKKCTGIGR